MSWEDYDKQISSGPSGLIKVVSRGLIILFLGAIIISSVGYVVGWFGDAAKVAKEEFSPRAMLDKYEYFKDSAAQLDKKIADIAVYKNRLTTMEKDYEGVKRKDWDRTDKEQFNLWSQEVAGVIASFNGLAAEYNAQMAKFNWRFANKGMLPEGATDPLPREYKPYQMN